MISELLLEAFTDALDEVRDTVVGRYKARTTEFAVDPGEIYSDVDWSSALVNAGVPEAVATNIIANAAGEFGFDEILEAGFDDIQITVRFEGADVRVTTQGLKNNFSQVVQEHVDALEGYTDSIRGSVQETIDEGIRTGTSVDDLAEELFNSNKFNESSARAFAQTETIAASNGTSYAGYPDDAFKEWLYTHDNRVRPTHEEAGKRDPIPMKDLFVVGSGTARYPGDPSLPPGERIWCRCTLAPVLSLTASGGSIESSDKTRDNLQSDLTRERFENMADKTVTLTIKKSEEAASVTTEAVDLSKAERNCTSGGSCCNDCADKAEAASGKIESFDAEDAETFAEEEEAGNKDKKAFEWEGVLTVEGLPSGDGRMIAEGALDWRDLPVPLMLQTKTASGHAGAEVAGSIVEIERVGGEIIGRGYFDSGEAGQEFKRLIEEGTMSGVSVDLDMVATEFRSTDGRTLENMEEVLAELEANPDEPFAIVQAVVQGRIMGATGTPFPAFQEAKIEVLSSDDREALVASGATQSKMIIRTFTPVTSQASAWSVVLPEPSSLVASAGFPATPSIAWFDIEADGDVADFPPFTVYPDGRCFGVIAEYGSCHIGFGECVTVPKPWDGFSHACNKTTLTDDGLVPTAPIYLNTVHPDLAKNASDTQTWYADTGAAVADVTLWDTPRGIVAAGAVRPSITEEELRTFRGSDVSPDWREIQGRLTMVGLLGVNVSGFIVQRDQVLVASAGSQASVLTRGRSVDGELVALVAAGIPARPDRFEELESLYGEMLHKFNTLTEKLGIELTTEEEPEVSAPRTIKIPKKAAHSIKLIRKSAAFVTVNTIREALENAITSRFAGERDWVWVRDFDLDTGTAYYEMNDQLYSIEFTSDEDGSVTLAEGEPTLVEIKYVYAPAE